MARKRRSKEPASEPPAASGPEGGVEAGGSARAGRGEDGGTVSPPSASGEGPDWRTLHLWQIQPVRDLMVIAGVFGLFYLGYVLRLVTVPMLLAMALAYLFEPLVAFVTSRRWMSRSQAASALIVIAGVLIVVPAVLGAGFAVAQGTRFWGGFTERIGALARSVEVEPVSPDATSISSDADGGAVPARTPRATEEYERLSGSWRTLSDWILRARAMRYVGDVVAVVRPHIVPKTLEGLAATVDRLVSAYVIVFAGFLTAFFFYFFCTGYGALLAFWEGLIPERKKNRVIDLLKQMDRVVAGFIRGRVMVGVFLAVFYALGYAIIGVPAGLLLGPIVGVLSIVPYVSMIGVPISVVLLWLEPAQSLSDSIWFILVAPVAVYAIGQFLDDYVLTPIIQSRSTDMDTPSMVFASIAGGLLAGVYGLLLAIPAAACLKILLREVFWPRFRAWAQGKERDFLPISE